MAITLKKLEDQVLVITGATSGIGLVTARMAANRGARLVLAARSEGALQRLSDELAAQGAQATIVVADVGREEDVRRIAVAAEVAFGGFDTWVNNAGVSIYGKLADVPIEDMRRLFETNFWGVVYGSREAVKGLKQRGGALITVGSALSERAILLQGIYSASKHAVKGFTDALRMELEAEQAPVSVTLIEPSSINTPYVEHAKNWMGVEAAIPPPVYAPELVAKAILHAATHPKRAMVVGGGGKMLAASGFLAPRATDKVMEGVFAGEQRGDGSPQPHATNGLDHPAGELDERGAYAGHTIETSPYTWAVLRPGYTAALVGGLGVAVAAWRRSTNDHHGRGG